MSATMHISLRAGEKIYINGGVLRVDRKVSLELLNDVTFLLESHVIQAEDAKTPLRQLYFVVQLMLIQPSEAEQAQAMFRRLLPLLLTTFENREIVGGLKTLDALVAEGRHFEALKTIRSLFAVENSIMFGNADAPTRAA